MVINYKVQIHDIDNVSLSVNNSGNSVNFQSVFRKYFTTRYPTRFLAQRSLISSSLTNFLQLNLATYKKIIGDELYSFVSRWKLIEVKSLFSIKTFVILAVA